MNEVEKMYRNANIEPLGNTDLREMKILVDGKVFVEGKDLPNNYYNIYPPFTAEKQIRIIEWLGNNKAFFDADGTIFSCITNHKDKNGVVKGYEGKGNSVDSCLAGLINNLWQDLTDAEKAQIRNILERR